MGRFILAMLLLAVLADLLVNPVNASTKCNVFAPVYSSTYTVKQLFNCIDNSLNNGNGYKDWDNEDGHLAWLENRVMRSYVRMYQLTGDKYYLEKLIDHADAVLLQRDSITSRQTYDGVSHPTWGTDGHNTLGFPVVLNDLAGNLSLEIQAVLPSHNNYTAVSIANGTNPNTYKITSVNTHNPWNFNQNFDNLTQDTVESVVNSYTGTKTIKVKRMGPNQPTNVSGLTFATQRYAFALHTGIIALPYAHFADIVKNTPALSSDSRYNNKANEYLAAAEAALAVHDPEWEEDGSRGYYRFKRGAPIWADGIVEPHNMYLNMGLTYLHLYRATGNTLYRDRAVKMANNFKYCPPLPGYDTRACLTVQSNGSYVWPYWWAEGALGWTEADNLSDNTPSNLQTPDAEDLGHGGTDMEFVFEMYENGLVFTQTDVSRFVTTVKDNILSLYPNRPERVNGTGDISIASVGIYKGFSLLSKFDTQLADKLIGHINNYDYTSLTYDAKPTTMETLAEMGYILRLNGKLRLAADADNNGQIAVNDFKTWAINYALSTTNGDPAGDFNWDGKVNLTDFGVWSNAFDQ